VALKEVFGNPWKQGQVNLFGWEREYKTMIVNKLNIFFQNVHKNSLIINSILETHNYFNIILIQELPWSTIWLIPSSASSEGEVLVRAPHHPN